MIKIENRKVVVVGPSVYPIIHEFNVPPEIGSKGYIITKNHETRLVLDVNGDIKLVKMKQDGDFEDNDVMVLESILEDYTNVLYSVNKAVKLLVNSRHQND